MYMLDYNKRRTLLYHASRPAASEGTPGVRYATKGAGGSGCCDAEEEAEEDMCSREEDQGREEVGGALGRRGVE